MEIVTCSAPQALHIGEDIVIIVSAIERDRVRMGINAPGRKVTAITVVPLPVGAADINLMGLGREK